MTLNVFRALASLRLRNLTVRRLSAPNRRWRDSLLLPNL
jgi:hypothetical protein